MAFREFGPLVSVYVAASCLPQVVKPCTSSCSNSDDIGGFNRPKMIGEVVEMSSKPSKSNA
jgi:hypothetical protein